MATFLCLPGAWLLMGCHSDTPATRVAVNLGSRLSEIYACACRTCREAAASDAPKSGDASAWAMWGDDARALVARVREGVGAMPPMGWCPECRDGDFEQIIAYMKAAR